MGYAPESTDGLIYTLRRRIPTRPMDENTPQEPQAGVRESEQRRREREGSLDSHGSSLRDWRRSTVVAEAQRRAHSNGGPERHVSSERKVWTAPVLRCA
jgi:hypothetical protein